MNPTTRSVLDLLRRATGRLSGEAIGRDLKISRSAVSKHIGALRREGYTIDSAPHLGHRLCACADTPGPEETTPLLKTRTMGRDIRYFETVDSTNTVAAREAAAGAPEGTVIVANTQTAGRGRQQRTWSSPSGCNLYFSIILRPRVPPRRVPQISLVAAVAVHQAILDHYPDLTIGIKWPNDILTGDGLKLCGILCESELETDMVHHAIVGIGLNVNSTTFPPELRGLATSLRNKTGKNTSRPAVLASILSRFDAAYQKWQKARDLAVLLPYIDKFSTLKGQLIEVHGLAETERGRVDGLTPEGELLLRTGNNTVTSVACGDVHLRG